MADVTSWRMLSSSSSKCWSWSFPQGQRAYEYISGLWRFEGILCGVKIWGSLLFLSEVLIICITWLPHACPFICYTTSFFTCPAFTATLFRYFLPTNFKFGHDASLNTFRRCVTWLQSFVSALGVYLHLYVHLIKLYPFAIQSKIKRKYPNILIAGVKKMHTR